MSIDCTGTKESSFLLDQLQSYIDDRETIKALADVSESQEQNEGSGSFASDKHSDKHNLDARVTVLSEHGVYLEQRVAELDLDLNKSGARISICTLAYENKATISLFDGQQMVAVNDFHTDQLQKLSNALVRLVAEMRNFSPSISNTNIHTLAPKQYAMSGQKSSKGVC